MQNKCLEKGSKKKKRQNISNKIKRPDLRGREDKRKKNALNLSEIYI